MNVRVIQFVILVLAAALSPRVLGDTVAMRSSVTLSEPRAVTLGDVAVLTGMVAEGARDVVIESDPVKAARGREWAAVGVAQVETALRDAGVSVSRLAITGGTCFVRFGKAPTPQSPKAEISRPTERVAEVVDLSGPPTIKTRIANDLARQFGVANDALRIKFDERDEEFLATSADRRRIAVEVSTSSATTRAVILVRIYDGDRLFEARTISADVEVKRTVVVVAQSVRRGGEIKAGDVREEERWMSTNGAAPINTADQVTEGIVARTRVSAGDVLRESDIQQAVVVKRGELVDVLCLSGALEIKSRARALKDGRRGDRIELRTEGSKKTFMARVDGPGRVVMVLGGEDESAANASASQGES